MKKILIIGGDGFCGWPTSLYLASKGHDIKILDNFARRKIDKELSINSLVKIYSIYERIKKANEIIGNLTFEKIDISKSYDKLKKIIKSFKPNSIIHLAEQKSAPYSMIDDYHRNFTVEKNIASTHNICSAITEVDKKIHLIHLGSMGVYGYSDVNGYIPEGYIDIIVKSTNKSTKILYPVNPGSIYHMTKCLDQLIFQYYVKNWNLKITDLHQGIVWGINTNLTLLSPILANRFDYDGIFGTVINRFISQAANNRALTIYGSGGQTRAFININDTAKCINLALNNDNFEPNKVRIFNQASETITLLNLAKLISKIYNSKIKFYKNPRAELEKNELNVINQNLKSLGFKPILLNRGLLDDIRSLAKKNNKYFKNNIIMNSPNW